MLILDWNEDSLERAKTESSYKGQGFSDEGLQKDSRMKGTLISTF